MSCKDAVHNSHYYTTLLSREKLKRSAGLSFLRLSQTQEMFNTNKCKYISHPELLFARQSCVMMRGYSELTSFYLLAGDFLGTRSDHICPSCPSAPTVCLWLPHSPDVMCLHGGGPPSRSARTNIATKGVFTGDYTS